MKTHLAADDSRKTTLCGLSVERKTLRSASAASIMSEYDSPRRLKLAHGPFQPTCRRCKTAVATAVL